jgi:hypothetical protein
MKHWIDVSDLLFSSVGAAVFNGKGIPSSQTGKLLEKYEARKMESDRLLDGLRNLPTHKTLSGYRGVSSLLETSSCLQLGHTDVGEPWRIVGTWIAC